MKHTPSRFFCLAGAALIAVGVQAEKFTAGGISFEEPNGWQTQKPSSSMRKAQFAIKGKDGKSAEVVFFHFGPGGAGGVTANVKRWLGQFREPADQLNAQTVIETINGTKVTYVTAVGTFMKGPPFGGNKIPVLNSGLIGAIIEGKQGAVFIKATGPKTIVKNAEKDMKTMVAKALKK
jgi:hypothetical protein|tara:strand:+ start:421 stop:954 length:534 start_codon:yes stop_codon:yes gene_type:complete